jgi:hypothetical protein
MESTHDLSQSKGIQQNYFLLTLLHTNEQLIFNRVGPSYMEGSYDE